MPVRDSMFSHRGGSLAQSDCPSVSQSVSYSFGGFFWSLLLWSIEMFMLRHINTTYMSRSHATHISSGHTLSKQQVTVGWLRWPTDSVTVRLNLRLRVTAVAKIR